MSEAIWLGSNEPRHLLELLIDWASPRKWRLFACAYCRLLGRLVPDDSVHRINLCEQFADNLLRSEALNQSDTDFRQRRRQAQQEVFSQPGQEAVESVAREVALQALVLLSADSAHATASRISSYISLSVARWPKLEDQHSLSPETLNTLRQEAMISMRMDQVHLLRDIFPNPYHPLPLGPAPNDAIRQLAQTIYDDRRFDHLPILADALEEAGCTSDSVLAHCRRPGPHVRGCWVVDALLGKC